MDVLMDRGRRFLRIAVPVLAPVLIVLVLSCVPLPVPFHLYLTWQDDPATTMTVNFHTDWHRTQGVVYYDTVPRDGNANSYAYSAQGTAHRVPGLLDHRRIHRVTLTGLLPGTTYYFVAGEDGGPLTGERSFRTGPDGEEPIRFVTGGDMSVTPLTRALLARAAERDPLFAVVGGDLAYANGKLGNVPLWDLWLSNWEELMVTPGGHMIPMVLAVGNHEVNSLPLGPAEKAPFFFGFFAQEGNFSYFSRSFGQNLVLFLLDSGHVAAHGGAQSEWLEQELAFFENVRYRFAVYHVPLYPSHRDFLGSRSILGRTHWLPLFDQYGLTAAFENHDHTHKRTHPLRDNQVDSSGTLYLGDGCLGVAPRSVDAERRWYEAKASGTPHFWLVDVTAQGVTYSAIDVNGNVFDSAESE